jgi:hypothetical protein
LKNSIGFGDESTDNSSTVEKEHDQTDNGEDAEELTHTDTRNAARNESIVGSDTVRYRSASATRKTFTGKALK